MLTTQLRQQAHDLKTKTFFAAGTARHLYPGWTQINGYPFGNELVLPCFLTEDALNRSITDDIACLTVLFSDFVRAALGHGVPVIVAPGLPHEYRFAHDALHHYQDGDGTLPYGWA